jgi:hypothetical protein
MNIWMDIEIRKEQQKDLVREAERIRAGRRARQGRAPAAQIYAPALARVGHWLTIWGTGLQSRYERGCEAASEVPSPAR